MSTFKDRNLTPVSGLLIRARSGVIAFETPQVSWTTTSGYKVLYVNSSNELVYDNGSSSTIIGAAGGGGTPSWETLFAADATFTITPDTTFTIAGNRSTATDVVTITNVAGGSGDCLQITNSGTGKDLNGTSGTWSVTKLGAGSFLTLTLTGTTITSSADNIAWTLKDNSATGLVIGSSGSTAILTVDTSDAAPLVKFGNGISLTDGNATFISTSNTVSNVLVTNNTATTFGADADSSGVVVFRSTSLTTGSLLQLQLTEGTLNGGFYLTLRDVTGGANVLTLGENGVIAMTGTAGSNSLAITGGDVVLSDGSLTLTDADDAASLSVTNNAAASASMVVFAGSGTFTGTTTSSFATLTASGLTSGTVLYMPVAGLTTGKAIHVVAATANMTTNAQLLTLDGTAATAGNYLVAVTTGAYTGTGMVRVSAGAATTGVLYYGESTTGLTSGSLLRLTSSTAGAIATNGAVSIRATGAFTSTSNVGYVDILASATTAGTVLRIASTAAAQTATELLRVDASGFTTGFTGSVATFTSSSTTGAGNVVSITSANTTAGTGMLITANALTTGVALRVTSSGTVTSAGEGVVNIVASGATTGDALKIDMTEGTLTTGHYINCYDDTATASVFSVGENGVVLFSDFTEVVSATNAITAAESGSVFFLSSATEFVSTLPAPVAGLHFTFFVSAAPSGASYTIVTHDGSDLIHGVAASAADAGGSVDTTAGTAADTITFVDGQALKGDVVDIWCDGTNWYAMGMCSDEDAITFTAT